MIAAPPKFGNVGWKSRPNFLGLQGYFCVFFAVPGSAQGSSMQYSSD